MTLKRFYIIFFDFTKWSFCRSYLSENTIL